MPKRFLPILFIVLGLVLLGGAVYSLARLGQSESTTVEIPAKYLTNQSSGSYAEIQRVTLEGAKAAYDEGIAVFLDVRGDVFYADSHIPGARSISGAELATRYNELNPEDWIIPYCS